VKPTMNLGGSDGWCAQGIVVPESFECVCALEWVKRKPSASMIASVKTAALKSGANRTACENEYLGINETAMAILQAHAARKALQENNTTPAARTLQTHRVDEPSVRDRLPDTFKQSGLLSAQAQPSVVNTTAFTTQLPTDKRSLATDDVAIRMPEFDTRKSLPAEWQDAKTNALAKQKAGQLRTWNDAQNTLKVKPNKEQSALDDNVDYGPNGPGLPKMNGMTQAELPQPTSVQGPKNGKSVGAQTQKSHQNQEGQWPSNPGDPYYPEETASSRSPGSRW
jgi:hypothetical protein